MMNRGFTLIELLVVMATVVIISTIVLIAVGSAIEKGKITRANAKVAELSKVLEFLASDTNKWPGDNPVGCVYTGDDNEVEDLNVPGAGIVAADASFVGWGGPYMTVVEEDPWGTNYFFDTDYNVDADDKPCDGTPGIPGSNGCIFDEQVAVLGSYGPDGIGNGLYNEDDIIKIVARGDCSVN
jgi:prepilin-type N-terminal cleavage/methylation domain-containing protein